jgi:hypothetical protein
MASLTAASLTASTRLRSVPTATARHCQETVASTRIGGFHVIDEENRVTAKDSCAHSARELPHGNFLTTAHNPVILSRNKIFGKNCSDDHAIHRIVYSGSSHF